MDKLLSPLKIICLDPISVYLMIKHTNPPKHRSSYGLAPRLHTKGNIYGFIRRNTFQPLIRKTPRYALRPQAYLGQPHKNPQSQMSSIIKHSKNLITSLQRLQRKTPHSII